jgi:hypothetical protein
VLVLRNLLIGADRYQSMGGLQRSASQDPFAKMSFLVSPRTLDKYIPRLEATIGPADDIGVVASNDRNDWGAGLDGKVKCPFLERHEIRSTKI